MVCVNPVAPAGYKGQDLEAIEYHGDRAICEHIEDVRSMFGADCEIYALGFSLGSNHLLRHLGSHKDCEHVCGIKAAVSISGAFEIPANTITLRKKVFGIYDWYMMSHLQKLFAQRCFKL